MRTISKSFAVAATAGEVLLFPNSIRNSTGGGDRDVWLGGCYLSEIRFTCTAAIAITITVYDGLVSATQQIVVGGSAPRRHRVTVANAGTVDAQLGGLVDANWTHTDAAALNANVTGQRVARTLITTAIINHPYRFPVGMAVPIGCTVRFSAPSTTATISAEADFIPWVSGGFRRRLNYTPIAGQFAQTISV